MSILELADQLRESESHQVNAQEETTGAVTGLTETFKQFFKAERRDKESDKLEASREQQGAVTKAEAVPRATSSGVDALDFGGSYVAMIGGAIAGLATGLTNALVLQIGGVTKAIGRFFKIDVLLKAIGTKVSTFSKTIANFFKPITNFFVNISKQFKAGFAGLTKARSATGQFMKLGIFGRIGSFFASVVKPFKDLANVLRGAFSSISTGGGIISKFFGALKSFFSVFMTIGSKLLIPLQIVIGLFAGIKGAFKGFTEFEGNFVEQAIAGGFGAIKGIINSLIMMPLDLLKDGVSWIAGKLGFEGFAEILDGFSFTGLFTSLLDGITGLVTSIFSDFDTSSIFMSLMKIMKRIALFPTAVAAGAGAALVGLFTGDPLGAFKKTFNKVLTAGEGAYKPTGGTGGSAGRKNNMGLEKPDQKERSDMITAAQSKKESRQTVVIDNSTNDNSQNGSTSLALNTPVEQPVKKGRNRRG